MKTDTLQHTATHCNILQHTATQNLTNAGKAALAREVSSIVSNIKSLETAASVSSAAPPSTSEARSSVASALASESPSDIPAASAPGGFLCFQKSKSTSYKFLISIRRFRVVLGLECGVSDWISGRSVGFQGVPFFFSDKSFVISVHNSKERG